MIRNSVKRHYCIFKNTFCLVLTGTEYIHLYIYPNDLIYILQTPVGFAVQRKLFSLFIELME